LPAASVAVAVTNSVAPMVNWNAALKRADPVVSVVTTTLPKCRLPLNCVG
jgi:hypothetical protein